MGKSVAFTGHRPESLPFGRDMDKGRYDDFELILWKEISRCMDEGYDTFYCGGARGADIVCGEIIIAEKLTLHPDVRLICAIPYKEQADKWGWMWKMRYFELLRAADKIKQLCSEYQRGCFHIRNRYMVDNCDLLIAIYIAGTDENKAFVAISLLQCYNVYNELEFVCVVSLSHSEDIGWILQLSRSHQS